MKCVQFQVVLVDEGHIAKTVLNLVETEKLVVEGGGVSRVFYVSLVSGVSPVMTGGRLRAAVLLVSARIIRRAWCTVHTRLQAAGVAALVQGCLPELEGKNVVIPLCGGNIDMSVSGAWPYARTFR